MNVLKISKIILDILYYVGIFGLILIIGFIFIYSLDYNIENYKMNLKEYPNLTNRQTVYYVYPFLIIALILYVLIVRNFRRIIILFHSGLFFGLKTSEYLSQIGSYLILSMFLCELPPFILSIFSNKSIVKFSLPIGFDSSLFLIAIGLFFIALSQIFKKALKIQQENDLTI